ncbi:MAG: GH32 C-terminal domain-containing protein, partial [Lachnospiraceae bacterium]|nr:GH32 C-terminal domain-containing protein [Lachnospiraceae bacterium]
EANKLLKDINEDTYCLKVTFEYSTMEEFAITLKTDGKYDKTAFTYNPEKQILYGETSNPGKDAPTSCVSGHLDSKNNTLTAEIFVDRSLVEGFFNNDKALSIRSYCENNTSTGIVLTGNEEMKIKELTVIRLK